MILLSASTLILLAKAELLDVFLENIPQPVAIPKEVEKECCGAGKSLDSLLIEKAIRKRNIKVTAVKNRKLRKKLQGDFPLAKGEAAAVALAVSAKAALVGIDDQQGINACKLLGIPFTTALAILIRMRENGLIPGEEALLKLDALRRYGRYQADIIRHARWRREGS